MENEESDDDPFALSLAEEVRVYSCVELGEIAGTLHFHPNPYLFYHAFTVRKPRTVYED